jgi:hypothetical protein
MPKAAETTISLTLPQARAVWLAAQGLPPAAAKPALLPTLERTGFVRTLGGVDVYLAVRARVPGLTRADLDALVERHDAQVVPAARGCIYLVPRRDVPFALRAAHLLSRARDERDQQKAGIKPGEVEKVAKAALAVLEKKGPLTTDALRRALPEGTVRSLGEQGRKVGVSSPLPGALRLLEFEGRIERTLEGGRLDTERYLWRTTAKNPFAAARVPDDPAELWLRLALVYFRAAGLGTRKAFAEWAGISQRDAQAAADRAGLVPVTVEGQSEPGLMLESERRALLDAEGTDDAIAFLPFDDNLLSLRGTAAELVDPAHHGLEVPTWGGGSRTARLGDARYMAFRSIVAEGKVAGFWEFDPDAGEVVHACFDKVRPATRKRLEAGAADVARFLAKDLGHGRSFSIDTDEELKKRVAQIRKLRR